MRIHSMISLLLPLLAGAIHPAAGADECVFPDAAREQATPESQRVDSAKLQAAVDYLREAGGKEGVKRMVIVRNGRMIWRGPEATKPQGVWSVTKAFTSTAHGLLIEDGKCTLDTLAKDFDPALAKLYPTVTLRHFATMTSGFDGVGGGYDYDDQRRGDQNALVEPLPPFFPPGTKYMYWDEATQHYGYNNNDVGVMLFQGFSISRKSRSRRDTPWAYHPFHRANNVNEIDGDLNGDGEGYETHELRVPEITRIQEAFVRQVVDIVNDLDNVIHGQPADPRQRQAPDVGRLGARWSQCQDPSGDGPYTSVRPEDGPSRHDASRRSIEHRLLPGRAGQGVPCLSTRRRHISSAVVWRQEHNVCRRVV
jgi:hypothetical protein